MPVGTCTACNCTEGCTHTFGVVWTLTVGNSGANYKLSVYKAASAMALNLLSLARLWQRTAYDVSSLTVKWQWQCPMLVGLVGPVRHRLCGWSPVVTLVEVCYSELPELPIVPELFVKAPGLQWY